MRRKEVEMNKQYSDQILDSLLDEMLGGKQPPDLKHSIVAAWQSEQRNGQREGSAAGSTSSSQPSTDSSQGSRSRIVPPPLVKQGQVPHDPAMLDSGNGGTRGDSIDAPPVQVPRLLDAAVNDSLEPVGDADRSIDGLKSNRTSSAYVREANRKQIAMMLAAVACVLLLLCSWQFGNPPEWLTGGNHQASDSTDQVDEQSDRMDGDVDARLVERSGSGNSPLSVEPHDRQQDESSRGLLQEREVLDLDDLPFSLADSAEDESPESEQTGLSEVERMESTQLVNVLNRKLNAMWQAADVTPAADDPPEVLAQRIARELTGQWLNDSELARVADEEGGLDKAMLVNLAISSSSFSQHWAERMSSLLLQAPLDSNQMTETDDLKRYLAEQFAQGKAWSDVVEGLIGADWTGSEAAASRAFFAGLLRGENHRLLSSIGSNFLDVDISCVRCHDALGQPRGGPGMAATALNLQQRDYWSLVAAFEGLEFAAGGDSSAGSLRDDQWTHFSADQPPTVFYDRPDGVLRAAEAGLPDGQRWSPSQSANSPRVALAQWLARSEQLDRALVNQVWQSIFGRHLVSRSEPRVDLAHAQRSEIQQLLAKQFRAHGRDLRSLAAWIVASEAFAKSPLVMERSEWLNATDEQLAGNRKAELLFAARPSLGQSTESSSLEASLAALIDWRGGTDRLNGNPTALAQPRTETEVSGRNQNQAERGDAEVASPSMPSMAFIYHAESPLPEHRRFVRQLLDSDKLSWDQRVDHVVGWRGDSAASGQIHRLAKQLLEQRNGDVEAALLDLLWAVENADAARLTQPGPPPPSRSTE
jgi:hypothetical protein